MKISVGTGVLLVFVSLFLTAKVLAAPTSNILNEILIIFILLSFCFLSAYFLIWKEIKRRKKKEMVNYNPQRVVGNWEPGKDWTDYIPVNRI
jgi:hypothetical protein